MRDLPSQKSLGRNSLWISKTDITITNATSVITANGSPTYPTKV